LIDFFAHDFWSSVWLMSLSVAGIITGTGGDTVAKRILAALVANYLITRCVVFFGLPDGVWIANDLVTTVALALCGRTIANYACTFLFFIIFNFGLAMFLGFATFAPVAAMSDLLGYIILIIIASSARFGGKRKINTREIPIATLQ